MTLELSAGLVLFGVLLLLTEVFVPGMVMGILGGLLVLAGVAGGFQHSAMAGLSLLLAGLAGGCGLGWLGIKFFPRSPAGRRLILHQDGKEWQGYDGDNGALLGARGTSHSPLRPAGIAVIDGHRIDVVTRGDMIAAGRPVEVIEVEGNRIVVKESGN